jgi:hypothetical protein
MYKQKYVHEYEYIYEYGCMFVYKHEYKCIGHKEPRAASLPLRSEEGKF